MRLAPRLTVLLGLTLVPAVLHGQPGQLHLPFVEDLARQGEADAQPVEPGSTPPSPNADPMRDSPFVPAEEAGRDEATRAGDVLARDPGEIEAETGGQMSIAAVDTDGVVMLGFNREQRSAMCETALLPLAIALIGGDPQPARPGDTSDIAPPGAAPAADLAQAALTGRYVDAVNHALERAGGPDALTRFARVHGDIFTRFDRMAPAHIEDAAGDERDTSTPAAMAGLIARLMFHDMPTGAYLRLRAWLDGDRADHDRPVGAGLPDGWSASEIAGPCTSGYGAVALVRSAGRRDYVIAIYITRPTADRATVLRAVSEASGATAAQLTAIEKRRPLQPAAPAATTTAPGGR